MYLNATGKRLPALQLMTCMEGSERRYEKDRKTKICRSAVYKKRDKEYDYLCDDKSIREGDTVIVEGIDGETKVKVCKIFEREEIKSEITESFYKSVIRKC